MKRRWSPKTVAGICLMLALMLVLPLVGVCAAPAPKGPIVLDYIVYTTKTRAEQMGAFWFADRVAELSKGELTINYKGGPEVMPPKEMFAGLREGVMDVLLHYVSGHEPLVPGVYLIHLAKHNPDGTRPQAVNDFINKLYEPVGVRYLTQVKLYDSAHIYTNVKVANLDDMRKLRVAAYGSSHIGFVKAAGATPVSVDAPERYTALERGVVDAAVGSIDMHKVGLHEVTKYVIFPPYKWRNNRSLFINLNSWNRLPKHLQGVLTEATQDLVRRQLESDLVLAEKNLKVWLNAGVERINLTGADAKKYGAIYDAITWKKTERLGPEKFRKAHELADLAPGCPKLPGEVD